MKLKIDSRTGTCMDSLCYFSSNAREIDIIFLSIQLARFVPLLIFPNVSRQQDEQKKAADCTLQEKCGDMGDVPKVRITTKKFLKGHINKVNSVHFAGDSRHCVTGSLDGKLIIWDTWTGNKVQVIPLRSAWVMSVAYADSGNFVACGGMDNMCTVYDLNNRDAQGNAKIVRELMGYEGFLSSCRFLDDTHIITGSGDLKMLVSCLIVRKWSIFISILSAASGIFKWARKRQSSMHTLEMWCRFH